MSVGLGGGGGDLTVTARDRMVPPTWKRLEEGGIWHPAISMRSLSEPTERRTTLPTIPRFLPALYLYPLPFTPPPPYPLTLHPLSYPPPTPTWVVILLTCNYPNTFSLGVKRAAFPPRPLSSRPLVAICLSLGRSAPYWPTHRTNPICHWARHWQGFLGVWGV